MTAPTLSPRHGRAALGDATKASILKAAARVFAAQGFSGARIDAIAAEAGVNKALLYYHFDDKEQLFTAVFERQFEESHGAILAALNAEGSAAAALLHYAGVHFDALAKARNLSSLHQQFLADRQVADGLIHKYALPRAMALKALLARGIASGEFRPFDTGNMAISVTSLLVHYFSITPILKRVSPIDPTAPEQLALRRTEILSMIRHAVFADPSLSVP